MRSKLGRMWESLLPGMVCLSPMGAVAYYCAGDEMNEGPNRQLKRVERRGIVSEALIGAAVIPLARL